MRVVIATVQVPFVYGGAEIHAAELNKALLSQGHESEIVTIPFQYSPSERILDSMLISRLLDLSHSNGQKIDRLIALKFPAYLIPHHSKVILCVFGDPSIIAQLPTKAFEAIILANYG